MSRIPAADGDPRAGVRVAWRRRAGKRLLAAVVGVVAAALVARAHSAKDRAEPAGSPAPAAPSSSAPLERDIRVTLSTSAAAAGERVVARFSGIPRPSNTDWISLFRSGDPDTAYGEWSYLNAARDGTWSFDAPAQAGTYEVRLFLDWPRGQYVSVARSGPLVVLRSRVDLTGVWLGDDGSRCRAVQEGDELWWLCEPARAGRPPVVGHGTVDGSVATLRVAAVPGVPARALELERDPSRPPASGALVLTHESPDVLRASGPGGRADGGPRWRRAP